MVHIVWIAADPLAVDIKMQYSIIHYGCKKALKQKYSDEQTNLSIH